MPTSKSGRWILNKEEEMNPDHINYTRQLYREMKLAERKEQTEYMKRHVRELRSDLNLARKYQEPVNPQPGKT